MRWGNPNWLWFLVLVPLLVVAVRLDLKGRKGRLARFASPEVWPRIIPELSWNFPLRKTAVLALALVFLIFALARPKWGTHEETIKVKGLDIILLLDVSNSMEVEDVVPNRLKKAKHLLRTMIDRIQGDRVGIIAFAGSAYPACPLTTDLDYVLETLEILGPAMVLNQGTDIGIGLEVAMRALDRGAEDTSESDLASRVIVLISDGEDHEEGAIQRAKLLKKSGTRLFVFGVGTEKGGPIPVRDDTGQLKGFRRTEGAGSIVSTFKADALKKVASEAGGRYWTISPSETEVDDFVQELNGLARSDLVERKKVTYIERFQIPLALGFFLLLLEMALPARKRLEKLVVLLLGMGLTTPVYAKPPGISTYLNNKKALESMQRKEFNEARTRLGAAQASEPERPEIDFNLGHLSLLEESPDRAVESFESAFKKAGQEGDASFEARSKFNKGNVEVARGKLDVAALDYARAIERARVAGDSVAEAAARKNLGLLHQERKKQKQENNDKKDKKDGEKGEQQKDQGDGAQEKKDQQDQSKSGQDQRKEKQESQVEDPAQSRERKAREFKSKKMTREDAERVMAELSSREKELQKKLKKQKGSVQPTGKDW